MLGGKRAREGETKNADNSALMVSLLNSALIQQFLALVDLSWKQLVVSYNCSLLEHTFVIEETILLALKGLDVVENCLFEYALVSSSRFNFRCRFI